MAKQIIKNILSIVFLLLLVAPIAIVCARYDGLYFLLYLSFWVLIPGYSFLHFFKKYNFECNSKAICFVLAFSLGSISLFIEYFSLYFLGAINLISYINPVISLISTVVLYTNYKKHKFALPQIKQLFCVLSNNISFIFLWLIATYIFALLVNFYMLDIQGPFHVDYKWQIGNVNQLASAYPFEDIRVSGVDYKYHYFNTLFYAIEKIIFDIPGWVIFAQHQIIIIPLLFALSLYSFYEKIAKNKLGTTLFCLFAFSGFSFNHSYNNFMFNWGSNMNAITIVTIATIALYYCVCPLLKNDVVLNKKSVAHIIISTLLLVYVSGLKGPYSAIFAAAIACLILMQLLRKTKPTKPLLLLFLSLSFAFSLAYITLLSTGTTSYFSYDLFSGILYPTTRVSFFSEIPYIPALRLIMLIPSLFFTITLILFPLILCAWDCVLYVFKKKDLTPDIILVSFLTVIGITAYYFFQLPGKGEFYFLFCSIPFAGYLALNKMLELFNNRPNFRKICVAITAIASVYCLYSNFFIPEDEFSISMPITYFTNQARTYDKSIVEEFEAHAFSKEYITDDRLIFGTRTVHPTQIHANYYDISAFAEKRSYLEGYYYSQANFGFDQAEERLSQQANFFGNSLTTEQKHTFAAENNIGYAYFFKNDTYEEFELTPPETGELFELIFENDSVSIYEVLN